ncbi:MAG: Type 1 glutamine amidotransferase-like domain-containing protein [Actinomycetes bacterium]
MPTPRIMATSGGFVPGDRYTVAQPGRTLRRMLELTGKDRPTLTFIMTASGDDRSYLTRSYAAFRGWNVDLQHLELFSMPNADPSELIGTSDAVWVGGGSVANLLELWRLHGVDAALRDAWERGVVLGGVSAGSICWHQGGTTDSFGPELRAVTNGLGFLPYANGVHYDSEEQRRPLVHSLVRDGTLGVTYCTDDYAGILYEGTEPVEVIIDRGPTDEGTPMAYRVELKDGAVVETPLPPGTLA